ncbi:SNF2 family N-terminal domain-containing protein [Aspergillus heterothallicus]
MAEVEVPQVLESNVALLKSAKARKNSRYAKEALGRARLVLKRGHDPSSQADPSTDSPAGDSAAFVPPFPHLAGFDGQPTDEVINVHEMFLDDYPGPQSGSLNQNITHISSLESIEKWYKRLKNPTAANKVRYAKAKRSLEIRRKRSESRRHIQEEEAEMDSEFPEESDQEIFVPGDDEPEASASAGPSAEDKVETVTATTRPARKKKTQNRITADEKRKSMAVGFEPIRRKAQSKVRQRGNRVTKQPKAARSKVKVNTEPTSRKGQKRKITDDEPDVLQNIRTNVIQEAHASAGLAAPEQFTASKRDEAIFQMIAPIPTADQEEAKSDGDRLKEALRKFNHRVVSDTQGGWKMKGLKTSMFNYQVLGCAFMRERENSPEEPRGGILGDVMGIGKTLQALVNILDGVPLDPDDPVKTTLLVVPSHLTKHWMEQIRVHCSEEALTRVIQYHAGSKFITLNDRMELENYQIVITTYDEVRRSYPTFKPSKQLLDLRRLEEQWKQTYEKECGPLHRIKFHRIVLDEAHMIKNKESSVSLAVRGLTGRHKWILSGTPIHNANEEFFPLLSFIGVPKLGDYEDFMSYYCTDEEGTKRLSNLLRAFMMRRTHASRLFSLPIIQLPDINERIVNIKFSEAERLIYDEIKQYYINSINRFGNEGNFKAQQCRECLTMFLRLRMFCSHPLTVQGLLKELLRGGSLMRQLNKLAREGSSDPADSSVKIVKHIGMLQDQFKLLVQQNQAQRQAHEQEQDQEQEKPEENPMFYDNTDLITQFTDFMKKLHQDEQWDERYFRSECAKCGSPPDKPVISSCMHLWCDECFTQLCIDSQRQESENQGSESSERTKLVCLKCTLAIESATRCCFEAAKQPEQPVAPAERKTKKQAKTKLKEKSKKRSNTEDEDDIENQDWMKVDTTRMPAAKITGIKNILEEWRGQNPTTKVVIFSQFTDMIEIIANMCKSEKWKYRCLTGKVPIAARHKFLDEFKAKEDITILIVSLRAGGIGLDMTAAHKCILVDLWWNEAIQNQAFCRLLRKGQTQTVECVKMVVEDSIDDYMLKIQARKTEEIASSMGDDVMKHRDSVIALLRMFQDVTVDGEGRLDIKSKRRTSNRR